ncbi:MAG: hypothetical protein HP477_09390 [Nitrospira sp.]|nr:hypothetical protein [Nitrospira sp.]
MENKGSTEKIEEETRSRSKKLSFGELFAEIAQNYPDLSVPNSTTLNKLDEAYIRAQKNNDTRVYISASGSGAFFLLSFSILMTWGHEALTSLQISLLPYLDQNAYLNSHPGLAAGLVLTCLATVIYAFVFIRLPLNMGPEILKLEFDKLVSDVDSGTCQ